MSTNLLRAGENKGNGEGLVPSGSPLALRDWFRGCWAFGSGPGRVVLAPPDICIWACTGATSEALLFPRLADGRSGSCFVSLESPGSC